MTFRFARSLMRRSLWLFSGAVITSLTAIPKVAQAQTTLPSNPQLTFQTSGPARCANIGDWYTTNGSARASAGALPINDAARLCFPTDPPGNQTTNPASNRVHRFFINVTATDLAASGGSVTVTIQDAGTGGALDEVDGESVGVITTTNYDPTRFQLLDSAGNVLGSETLSPSTNAADIGRNVTSFPPITQPGVYSVTSLTGQYAVNGYTGAFNEVLNNDDNGFRIAVSGIPEILIGQFQGTFQNSSVGAINADFFLLVGPGTNNLLLRNFDFDNDGSLAYSSPTGGIGPSTISGNASWNSGGDLNNGGDILPVNGLANAGRWQVAIGGYGAGFTNQSLLEANSGTTPDPNRRLPLFDTPPRRAGNVVITQSPNPPFSSSGALCYAFTVSNLFFTTDIINLDLTPNDPNFTSQFRDANGQNPLTDTDGDGRVDTGILQPNETRTYTLCITANPGAPSQFNFQIGATSFLDSRVRQQAGVTDPPTRVVIDLGFSSSPTGGPNFRLVKRITNVTRGGATLPGVNFAAVIDDPNSSDDNALGFSQFPLTGILALTTDNPVRSGDEVTYTVYFLADGGAPAIDASICDPIPGGTTFVLNSLELGRNNSAPTATDSFFTPLSPLPDNNPCPIQTNPNGATIVQLGTVSNVAGSNFGFIRFRVRVN